MRFEFLLGMIEEVLNTIIDLKRNRIHKECTTYCEIGKTIAEDEEHAEFRKLLEEISAIAKDPVTYIGLSKLHFVTTHKPMRRRCKIEKTKAR